MKRSISWLIKYKQIVFPGCKSAMSFILIGNVFSSMCTMCSVYVDEIVYCMAFA